ncbi:MAG: hypothetical protein EXR69_04060 [Myxococcales bacterium]|nr:hypothetical protein [Myxococcales bacterium]
MRILHVTDSHLGIRWHFRGAPTGWSRADDHLLSFKAALANATDAVFDRVDAVIHSGDLFDRSHPPRRRCPRRHRSVHRVRARGPRSPHAGQPRPARAAPPRRRGIRAHPRLDGHRSRPRGRRSGRVHRAGSLPPRAVRVGRRLPLAG